MTTKISEANIQATTLGALGGGGPKISSIIVTDSSYNNLDDTAVALGGGYIKLIGEDFAAGCQVLIGLTPVTSVTFVSDTEVRAQVPATAAGTYIVYLVNSDGGTAIRVNAITFSSTPTWVTGSTLSGISDTAISVQLAATGASTFSLQAGSSLPTGLSLSSSGLLSGSVTVVNETVYNFTVNAIDAELQDSPRTFSITISYGDLYFMYNTLVLPGASTSFIKDESTNNLTVTVSGDTKPNGFSPYPPGYYSVYFDGTSNSNVGTFTGPTIGVDDYTVEFWVYLKAKGSDQDFYEIYSGSSLNLLLELDGATNKIRHNLRNDAGTSNFDFNSTSGIASNTWYHLAFVVSGTTAYTFINGNCTTLGATASLTGARTATYTGNLIGSLYSGSRRLNGYMSNLRMVKGTALYTSNFTPPTSPLTAVDGTALLILQSNRFIDNSTSNHSITSVGSSNLIKSFQPFTLSSSYSTYGSAYFDGSEDYLNIASNSAFAYGTGDFEISFWYYPISASGYLFDQRTAQPQVALTMYYDSGSINVYINGAIPISGTEPKKNAWHYLTLSRVSGSTRLFVDGAQIGSTAADSNNYGTLPLRIGCRYATTNDIPYGGYMSNFRVVKGSGVSSQTVPTIPLTAIANTSLLILQNNQPITNNVFLDSSNNEFNITRLGDTTQGSFSPYGSNWSTYFDGSGDTLTTPSTTSFNLSTNPFCIEMWFYWTGGASSGYSGLCGSASDYKIALSIWNSKIMYGASSNGSSWNILAAESSVGANTVVANQWNHLVLCRTGNTFSGYLNGIRDITTTSASAVVSRTEGYVVGAWYSSLYYFSGYISNFRFVVGSNPYNATGTTITVPTTPLSAISDTALLTSHANRFIDGSTNNFAITNNNEARVQRFSPFRNASAYDPSIHGGSAYLDGTGDNLQIPYTALYVPGADPYSIEVWVYFTGSGTNQGVIGTTSDGFAGFERGSGSWQYYYGSSGTTTGVAVKLYQWNHVVICRNAAGAGAFFVNGSRLATFTDTGSKSAFGNLQIGYNGVAGGAYTTGYITDYRYVIGNPYDPTLTTLTVPTAPLTAIANTQVLCNFTGAAIVDNAMQNNLATVGDAKISTTQSKFGGSSMYFDGTGDYLTILSNPSLAPRTGDFTWEAWIYFPSASSYRQIFSNRSSAGSSSAEGSLAVNPSNGLTWYTDSAIVNYTTSIGTDQWVHVSVCRSGTTLRVFVNGVSVGSATNSQNLSRTVLSVAANNDGSESFNGYIDDLRITSGYARYTANFTPPTTTHLLK